MPARAWTAASYVSRTLPRDRSAQPRPPPAKPHPTVPTSSYHKHIPPHIPEALRARHLLMWCASWASNQPASASTSKQSSSSKSVPLSAKDAKLAKSLQSEVLKLLAAGELDTNVMSGSDKPVRSPPVNLAPHDQNVKNLKRKNDFMSGIAQSVSRSSSGHSY